MQRGGARGTSVAEDLILQRSFGNLFIIAGTLLVSFLIAAIAHSQPLSDETLANLSFEQKLSMQVSLDLLFRDETGKPVCLGDYLGEKPVVLVLGYYQCPMLCTLLMNGMVEALQDLKWSIGKEFEVINVSIDPGETPELAAAKKRTYLKRYGRAGAAAGWHYLTGDKAAIQPLAQQVGFQYAYDNVSRQYAHPSGLVILTPQGKVAGYLFGITYSPKDLLAALKGASSNQINSPIRKLVLLCFHYNPIRGKYGAAIMAGVRLLSLGTILALAWLIIASVRTKRQLFDDASACRVTGHTSHSRHESDNTQCDAANGGVFGKERTS